MVWQFDPIKPHNCIMSNPINSYPNSWYVASSPMLAEQWHASGDLAYDVCVVGGGYTGLSCALHLATAGKSVAVLEAERVGWGASGRNGGHVGTGQRADQHTSKNGTAKRPRRCGGLGWKPLIWFGSRRRKRYRLQWQDNIHFQKRNPCRRVTRRGRPPPKTAQLRSNQWR